MKCMSEANRVADNATAQNDITHGQLAEAICKAVDVPCKAVTYEEAAAKVGGWVPCGVSVG